MKTGSDSMDSNRIQRVLSELSKAGITQMIVSSPSSIRYLTGIDVQPMERLYALILRTDGQHALILNHLFTVPSTQLNEVWLNDCDDGIAAIAQHLDSTLPIGIDDCWSARFLLPLMKLCPNSQFQLTSRCVNTVRGCKDLKEQVHMIEASHLNDTCMAAVEQFLHQGVTELETADFIRSEFLRLGASGTSFDPIVSFGANASDPHHQPDGTVLHHGDCVVIDMGCVWQGYCSDMTRTFFCGTPSPTHMSIHNLVREANERAEAVIRPGVRFCDVDMAAREHIANAGYGTDFTHRLGHFIGMECHETGDVSGNNTDPIKEGQIFSIEPGVYLPNEMGVRIEDLVLVTKDGCKVLNQYPKQWKQV